MRFLEQLFTDWVAEHILVTAHLKRCHRYVEIFGPSRIFDKVAPWFDDAIGGHLRYSVDVDADTVVYADMPRHESFNTKFFWKKMNAWVALGAQVIVRAPVAPEGWESLDKRRRKLKSMTSPTGFVVKIERLYRPSKR